MSLPSNGSNNGSNLATQHVVVIGGGIGGLASAILLKTRGYEVTLLEKNETTGGKLGEVRHEGYRFDTGPSVLTLPHLLERLFTEAGKDLSDYLTITPLSHLCRYNWPDGATLDTWLDRDRTANEIDSIAPGDGVAYKRALNHAKKLHERTWDAFLENPLARLSDLKSLPWADLLRIDAHRTLASRVDSQFNSEKLRMLFKRFATYNGSDPWKTPATLQVISHVELTLGSSYVEGGLRRLAEALETLARELGCEIRTDTMVNAITIDQKTATGVQLDDGTNLAADNVVSNMDATRTLRDLVGTRHLSRTQRTRLKLQELSTSGLVLLLACDRQWEQLRHHNIFFSRDYQREFQEMVDEKRPASEPTIYVTNTSLTDPNDAPPGGSNLFVLINTPPSSDRAFWEQEVTRQRTHILDRLEKAGLPGLCDSIIWESHLSPTQMMDRYEAEDGSIYGSSSNGKLSAFLRPGNRARGIHNLYLIGGTTHPGGGIPLVLLSAFHVAELVGRGE
ncbi:MAG: phytoene desaturase family protein [Balneolaceae bacterium]